MKKAILVFAALCACCAFGITATKEYVDRKDSDIRTNTYTKAETDAKIVELAPVPDVQGAIGAFAETGTVHQAVTASFATDASRANVAIEAQVADRLGDSETGDLRTAAQIFSALDSILPPTDMTPATNYADYAANAVKTNLIKRLTDGNAEAHLAVYMAENAINATSAATADTAARADQAERAWDATFAENLKAGGDVRSADEIFSALDGIPPPVDTSHLATKTELSAVSNDAQIVYRLFAGSNVVDEVTNYNSVVRLPSRRLYQLNESNEYHMVWNELDQHSNTLAQAKQYADDIGTNYAPRAWSRTTAGLGAEAPEGTTWLSTEMTVIAGGYEYEKHVTSGGAIWLLTSNGGTFDFSPSTNNVAFLNIAAQDGTPIFRIEKTDAYLVGVNSSGVSTETPSTLVVEFDIVAETHPLARVCADIRERDWQKEEDGVSSSLATVTWSGSSGHFVCRITNNTGGNSIFAYFEYLQEGGVKIVNEGQVDLTQGIIVNGVKFAPTISGAAGSRTLTWTEVQ